MHPLTPEEREQIEQIKARKRAMAVAKIPTDQRELIVARIMATGHEPTNVEILRQWRAWVRATQDTDDDWTSF